MVLNELSDKITKALSSALNSKKHPKEYIDSLIYDVTQALEESDISPQIVAKLRADLTQQLQTVQQPQTQIPQLLASALVKILDTPQKPQSLNPKNTNIVTFYGLQGQGKTTTATKYGAYYKRRNWRVGVVCCDTFRAGAFDQLKQNCTAAKLPFYGSYTEKNPIKIAQQGVAHFKKLKFNLIIIDTSGRHKQSEDLLIEMKQIDNAITPTERIFVVDASIGQACQEQALAFKKAVNIGSIILTKMDGSTRSGGALTAVASTNSPIIFLGTGEKFDDFEPFEAQNFVQKLLGFGDFKGLFDKIQSSKIDQKSQIKSLSKMMDGNFTFRDFRVQITEMLKMGPMEKLIEMIPGMSKIADAYGFDEEKEGTNAMVKWTYIMDSMTKMELDSHPILLQKEKNYENRILRIAKGSGFPVAFVKEFMGQMKQFSEMTKRYGKNQMGQQMKQMMNASVDGGGINREQMGQMQKMMGGLGGGMPGMPNIPGLNFGGDPDKAVSQLRQMGLLPGGDKEMKKLKKMAQGRK
ncbi:Signal recognition particle 54 [Spironucleus salmonicida]|uniref:signal-recognition-particle GTPase n=1 Tax=Spironucleus salmonicida TaxID=348837 RepID=V6LFQ9_9EUKA|nr:Signal recognition particle 54 [Spironucleus salmonicida]|eukprot:EST42541.1 Signal recognition particle 54 [Spironucleus salmonicida]